MKLGIPIYQGVNLLDVAGPLEMFFWANLEQDLQPILVSQDGSTVTSANKVCFKAQASFADTPSLDIVWVPGGLPDALVGIMKNPDSPYLKYLRQVAANAKWVCSVCEGALLLARAGLLDGHKATTHWQFVKCLQRFPGIDVDTTYQRFVVSEKGSEKRLTGGGISSGLDESLELILLLFGEDAARSVQKTTQYFPKPPLPGDLTDKPPDCKLKWT
jgi:transcriptional regulator GlxA family with amidase domain